MIRLKSSFSKFVCQAPKLLKQKQHKNGLEGFWNLAAVKGGKNPFKFLVLLNFHLHKGGFSLNGDESVFKVDVPVTSTF